MKREQAIIREIASMISIVACCHGAKLCAHAARNFRSQYKLLHVRVCVFLCMCVRLHACVIVVHVWLCLRVCMCGRHR